MNRLHILLLACSIAVAGCRKESPTEYYNQMQKAAQPFYNAYWNGSPEGSLVAIQNVEHLARVANPKTWIYMDRNSYMALTDARICLAFERLGRTNDAAHYRRKAIQYFQRRREFNSEYQEMLPVTPSPSAKDAEHELFFMVGKLDDQARKGGNSK